MLNVIMRRVWIWVALFGLAIWTWVTATVGYRAVYVLRTTDLDLLANGIQRAPFIVTGLSLVNVAVLGLLRQRKQLTQSGFFVAFGTVVFISALALALHGNWCFAVGSEFLRYKVAINGAPENGDEPLRALGRLRFGSVAGAGGIYVFPVDHTRIISAHDRLHAAGYRVDYEYPEFVAEIGQRYAPRPTQDPPP